MDPREIVDAYLAGKIESWGVYRRLVRLGVTTATALAVAGALPAAAMAQDFDSLNRMAKTAQEAAVLDMLTAHLASQIEKVGLGGPIRPLAATLARIGAQNANLNCRQCDPIELNVNDGFNNLTGEAVADGKGNLALNLNGSIGPSNVNLVGTLDTPNNNSNGNNTNVGKVNLNFNGNIGAVPLNLFGNLGNLSNPNNNNNDPD